MWVCAYVCLVGVCVYRKGAVMVEEVGDATDQQIFLSCSAWSCCQLKTLSLLWRRSTPQAATHLPNPAPSHCAHTFTHPYTHTNTQAALGYVSEQTDGFVDFDSVPDEGASAGEILAFVLGPEARDLRPLLVGWLAGAADLVLRDRWVGLVDGWLVVG